MATGDRTEPSDFGMRIEEPAESLLIRILQMCGRRLVDDVVDIVFTIINNGQPLGDKVDGNEVPFLNRFPFVAKPTQPFPPGKNPDDHTRQ